MKAHYGGVKIVYNLFFSKASCLNINHVIIMKDFHNFFAYYRRSNHKKITSYYIKNENIFINN